MKASTLLKEITPEGAVTTNLVSGEDETIAADYVILAVGVKGDNGIVEAFEREFNRVIPLGQTHKNPGRIATSMAEAYIAARGFNPLA